MTNEPQKDPAALLTVHQLAEWLSMPTTWIYDQVMLKKLPHYKIGRLLRFDRYEIEDYLRQSHRPALDRLPPPKMRKPRANG